jgi:hypothetical protein
MHVPILTSVYKRTRTFFTSACFCSRVPLPSPNWSATSTSPMPRIAGHTTSLAIAIRLAGRRSASPAARYGETTTRADKSDGDTRRPTLLPAKWKRHSLRRETRGPSRPFAGSLMCSSRLPPGAKSLRAMRCVGSICTIFVCSPDSVYRVIRARKRPADTRFKRTHLCGRSPVPGRSFTRILWGPQEASVHR